MNSEISQKPPEVNSIISPVIEPNQAMPSVIEFFNGIDLQNFHVDGKTGFPVEEGDFHINIVKKMNSSLAAGENIGVFKVDLNDLKKINDTFGHHIGDQDIIWSAEEMVKEFDSNFKDSQVKILFTRQSTGGDEYVAHITGIQEQDLVILNKIKANLNNRDKGNYSTIFSMTADFQTSIDEEFNNLNGNLIEKEKQFIKNNPGKTSFDFLDLANKEIDNRICVQKDIVVYEKGTKPFKNVNQRREDMWKEADDAIARGRTPEGLVYKLCHLSAADTMKRVKSGEYKLEDFDDEGNYIGNTYTKISPEILHNGKAAT